MVDHFAVIKPVAGYSAPLLRESVRNLLRVDDEIVRWLQEGNPERVVVVKPNWIQEAHEYKPEVWEPVITHPAVLLAVIQELAELMKGVGTICICDAPHTYANFNAIIQRGGFLESFLALKNQYPRLKMGILDLRRETWILREQVVVERRPNPPDPRGYQKYDLGKRSLFYNHSGNGRYYGADYDSTVVNKHHIGETHEYLLAGSPVVCDLFVNVPKLKTHKKTGITCCLKNLVGINGDKNWLPHHTEGTPLSGGDEFPNASYRNIAERWAKKAGRAVALSVPGVGTWLYRKSRNIGKTVLGDSESVIRNGNWSGNDTCWRMALDLNRALLFGNPDGTWRSSGPRRRYLAIVDGITGGEGNGPLCPDPMSSGVLIGGTNPATVDAVACRLMGFDPAQLPIVAQAFASHALPIAERALDEIEVDDGRVNKRIALAEVASVPGGFRPHFGWTSLLHSRN